MTLIRAERPSLGTKDPHCKVLLASLGPAKAWKSHFPRAAHAGHSCSLRSVSPSLDKGTTMKPLLSVPCPSLSTPLSLEPPAQNLHHSNKLSLQQKIIIPGLPMGTGYQTIDSYPKSDFMSSGILTLCLWLSPAGVSTQSQDCHPRSFLAESKVSSTLPAARVLLYQRFFPLCL